MTRSQWSWEFLDGEEKHLDRPLSPTFTTRFDAESWLGEQWRHLATQGVSAARLTDRGESVGRPLPLRGA
jgi:hypothetical protein